VLWLRDSVVHRSGVTVDHWNRETEVCRTWATEEDLRFRFDIASKGGGRTDIQNTIGKGDVPALFDEIARSIPEAKEWMALSISKATAAQRADLRELAALMGEVKGVVEVAAVEAERAYAAAPFGDDHKEMEFQESLEKALSTVKGVRDRLDALAATP